MKVKTMIDFLGIPKGEIGIVVSGVITRDGVESVGGSIGVKFPCKAEPVLLQYPFQSHYIEID